MTDTIIGLLSDIQMGAGARLGNGEIGPGSRFQDQCDVLDRIADLFIAERVNIVGVVGDVFEFGKPEPHEILGVQGFVRRLLDVGIKVLAAAGNHDLRGAALPSALEIFGGEGCVVALQPSIFPIGDVVIAVLPWAPPGHIVAAMGDGVARDDVNQAAAQGLVDAAHLMGARCAVEFPHLTPILFAHWAVSGASLPTGMDSSQLREPVIPLEGLQESGFQVIALGHLHPPQVLSEDPAIFYCGSPMVCDWGETGHEHGVWVLNLGKAA